MFRLAGFKNHAVVCGLGEKGKRLALDLLERKEQVVVIESDPQNSDVEYCREKGGIILEFSHFLHKQAFYINVSWEPDLPPHPSTFRSEDPPQRGLSAQWALHSPHKQNGKRRFPYGVGSI